MLRGARAGPLGARTLSLPALSTTCAVEVQRARAPGERVLEGVEEIPQHPRQDGVVVHADQKGHGEAAQPCGRATVGASPGSRPPRSCSLPSPRPPVALPAAGLPLAARTRGPHAVFTATWHRPQLHYGLRFRWPPGEAFRRHRSHVAGGVVSQTQGCRSAPPLQRPPHRHPRPGPLLCPGPPRRLGSSQDVWARRLWDTHPRDRGQPAACLLLALSGLTPHGAPHPGPRLGFGGTKRPPGMGVLRP